LIHGDRTALLSAAARDRGAVVKLLIDRGAGTRAKDKEGRAALSTAFEMGIEREKILRILLQTA